jgi:signal transduction histidine kinase/phage shock protein PspC (stress-responsive transcriptional regulator)
MQTDPTWRTPPKLYREPGKRVLGGVAAGIAEHLRLPVVVVRVTFIVLLAANGLGALLYVAFWGVLPVRPDAPPSPRSARSLLQGAGLVALAAGILIVQYQSGGFGLDATVVALVAVIGLGAGIIWHQADPERRRKLTDELPDGPLAAALRRTTPTQRETQAGFGERGWFLLRLVGGGGLVVVGIIGVLSFITLRAQNQAFGATVTGLFFALLALAGLGLALAPLLFRVFGQLREERVARIREQERAEVAAMVHDQVLHTLALIQRRAGDSASVLRLARGQERTLRNWLYKPTGVATERFAAALEEAAAEVEDTYGITVETVIVGDADTDEQVHALVAAAREAMVNAARHAKVSSVSLYAEAEEDKLSVFVRDRGPGFELSTVDDDRHGVRGSIIGRMRRHGGHAEIKTAPGEGTEVELTMPVGRAREKNHD